MSFPFVRSHRRLVLALLGSTILVSHAAPASAQIELWNGSQSTDWNDPANWTPNQVPGANNQAQINTQAPNAPTISPGAVSIYQLFVGNNSGAIANLTIHGALTSSQDAGAYYDLIGAGHASGSVNVAGPQARWTSGHAQFGIGPGSAGSLLLSDHAQVQVGDFSMGVSGATGQLGLTDSTLVTGDSQLGDVFDAIHGGGGSAQAQITRATWTTNNFTLGQGSLALTDSSRLNTGAAGGTDRIGVISGTVSVADSQWLSVADRLLIGEGVGGLDIDAGLVIAGATSVGLGGGSATVTVKNAGELDVTNLTVGGAAAAAANGATIGGDGKVYLTTSGRLVTGFHAPSGVPTDGIGLGVGSTGLVQLNAATWTSANGLTVGQRGGVGTLGMYDNSSYAAAGLLAVGEGAGGQGHVIQSNSSALLVVDRVTIGNNGGTGSMQLDLASAGQIGGSLSVGGNLFADVPGQTYVVSTASGLLNILSGSTVVTNTLADDAVNGVGVGAGSQGTVAVDGAGSRLQLGGDAYIGAAGGQGVIRASAGGRLEADGFLTIGGVDRFSGSDGATYGGIGLLGGSLLTDNAVRVGDNGAYGIVSIDGGSWDGAGEVTVGNDGGAGRVALSGAQSTWSQTGAVTIGALGGDGDVELHTGAQAHFDVSAGGALGIGVASKGVLALDGVGSLLTVTGGDAAVGAAGGRGYISLSDHAVLVSDGGLALGSGANATGLFLVANGSSATFGKSVALGADSGSGTLSLSGGSLVENGDNLGVMTVGSNATSRGEIIIQGGSALNTHDSVLFGGDGNAAAFATIDGPGSQWSVLGGSLTMTGGQIGVTSGSRLFTGGGGSVGGTGGVPALVVVSQAGSLWSTFGETYIGGVLAADGSITAGRGEVRLINGGALSAGRLLLATSGGTGTLVIDRSSTVAAGEYRQGANGTLLIGVDPTKNGASGRLTSDGALVLADGAHIGFVREVAGPYTIGNRYELLFSRNGPITHGTIVYDGLEQLSLFVGLVPTFGAMAGSPNGQALYLDVAQTRSFASVAATPNQIAAATGADSLGNTDGLKAAILDLQSEDQARGAFNSISGEIYPGVQTAMIEDSRLARSAVLGRLVHAEGGASAWLQGLGNWGSTGSDGNAASQKRQTKGLLIGFDLPLGETGLRAGLSGGFSDGDQRVDAWASHADFTSYQMLGYIGGAFGQVRLRAGGGYSWNIVDAHRAVAFPGFTDSLSAKYDAHALQVFGEIGYRMPIRAGWIEPFAGVSMARASSDGFTEAGGAAALTAAPASDTSTNSTLGLKGSTAIAGPLRAAFNIGWQHRFGDLTHGDTMRFAGGVPFSITGVPLAKDAGLVDLSLGWRLAPGATLSASYSGAIGAKTQDSGVRAALTIAF